MMTLSKMNRKGKRKLTQKIATRKTKWKWDTAWRPHVTEWLKTSVFYFDTACTEIRALILLFFCQFNNVSKITHLCIKWLSLSYYLLLEQNMFFSSFAYNLRLITNSTIYNFSKEWMKYIFLFYVFCHFLNKCGPSNFIYIFFWRSIA